MQALNHDPVSNGPEDSKYGVCARCGKPMTVQDKFCAICGHPRSSPAKTETRRQRTFPLIMAGTLLLVLIVAVIGTNCDLDPDNPDKTNTAPPKFDPSTLLPGSTVQLRLDGGTEVAVVPTQEVYKEWMKLAEANDSLGMQTMTNEGQMLWTPNGTRAKILESDDRGYRVRILDGPLYGQAVWTNEAFVKEDRPDDAKRKQPLSNQPQAAKFPKNNPDADLHNAQLAQLAKSLPVSRPEILNWYDPPPKQLGTFDTHAGTVVYTYELKHATLELEEKIDGPALVRGSLKFNIPEIRAATDTFLAVWLDCALFAKNIAGVNTLNDSTTLKRLGFDHAYDPGPDEIVNNGVRVRRFTKGGVLVFEVTPE